MLRAVHEVARLCLQARAELDFPLELLVCKNGRQRGRDADARTPPPSCRRWSVAVNRSGGRPACRVLGAQELGNTAGEEKVECTLQVDVMPPMHCHGWCGGAITAECDSLCEAAMRRV